MNGEFDGRKPDLAIGVVRGVRAFNVDDRGRLLGINFCQAWRPGENVARCLVNLGGGMIAIKNGGGVSWSYAGKAYTVSNSGRGGAVSAVDLTEAAPEPPKHAMGLCAHGFYAYYDGSNDYRSDARISAVVEGYGETFIGTRGFRSEKARIVALCIPKEPRGGHWPFVRFLREHDTMSVTLLGLSALWAVTSLIMAIVAGLQGDLVGAAVRAFTFAIAAVVIATIGKAEFTGPSVGKQIDPRVLAKIRQNYPDIPTFTSFDAMIAAYPPDHGLASTPTTDPHFWE